MPWFPDSFDAFFGALTMFEALSFLNKEFLKFIFLFSFFGSMYVCSAGTLIKEKGRRRL